MPWRRVLLPYLEQQVSSFSALSKSYARSCVQSIYKLLYLYVAGGKAH